jgi:hypothetical protein
MPIAICEKEPCDGQSEFCDESPNSYDGESLQNVKEDGSRLLLTVQLTPISTERNSATFPARDLQCLLDFRCGLWNQFASRPSSETGLSTPLEPTMEVLIAPDNIMIMKPAMTTNA